MRTLSSLLVVVYGYLYAESFKSKNFINTFHDRQFPGRYLSKEYRYCRKDGRKVKIIDSYGQLNSAVVKLPIAVRKPVQLGKNSGGILSFFHISLIALSITLSDVGSTKLYTIPNHFINYGHYCGPGPSDPFDGVSPIDKLDRVCQVHDQRYKMCLTRYHIPSAGTPQAVALRGILPWSRCLIRILPDDFNSCIHDADEYFVTHVRNLKAKKQLPSWWDHPSLAPVGAEGVKGYREACAVGLSNGFCVLSSRTIFSDFALELFEADLETDRF